MPTDMSEAQARRQIQGVNDLNGMEICAKVGIKKAQMATRIKIS